MFTIPLMFHSSSNSFCPEMPLNKWCEWFLNRPNNQYMKCLWLHRIENDGTITDNDIRNVFGCVGTPTIQFEYICTHPPPYFSERIINIQVDFSYRMQWPKRCKANCITSLILFCSLSVNGCGWIELSQVECSLWGKIELLYNATDGDCNQSSSGSAFESQS